MLGGCTNGYAAGKVFLATGQSASSNEVALQVRILKMATKWLQSRCMQVSLYVANLQVVSVLGS